MSAAELQIQIEAPQLGLVPGIPIDEYHRSPALSCSGLADFALSPFHFYGRHRDPARPTPVQKDSQLDGNLAHCAILEPLEFDKRYVVGHCEDKRLKAWRDWVGELEEGEDAREPVKPSQAGAAWAMSRSVRAIPDVAELLDAKGAQAEVSAFWIDKRTGVHCRCRPDLVSPVSPGKVILLDVKTFGEATPQAFARQVARMGYHRQAAWYSEGWAAASGDEVLAFVFVVVEPAWPFAACAAMLDEQSVESAQKENEALRARFSECQRSGQWPAFAGIQLVTLPAWATYREDPYA